MAESPSDSDVRFARRCTARGREAAPEVSTMLDVYPETALLVTGLPCFSDVTRTKILTMLLADCAGRLTGYTAVNGSVVTNTVHNNREHNNRAHNSTARPAYVVLMAHREARTDPPALPVAADDVEHTLREGEALVIPNGHHPQARAQARAVDYRLILRSDTPVKGIPHR